MLLPLPDEPRVLFDVKASLPTQEQMQARRQLVMTRSDERPRKLHAARLCWSDYGVTARVQASCITHHGECPLSITPALSGYD